MITIEDVEDVPEIGIHEDKPYICSFLLLVLHQTRNGQDIVGLDYEKQENEERVIIRYSSGGKKKVNVSMDSGTAMIRDIMNAID